MSEEQDRIVNLEEIIAYQTQTIDELSDQVAKQWKQMDRLQKQLKSLAEQFLELEEQSGARPEITKPPHY